jgi:GDP-4-dehydro-6-deoxy-D-mannose reductase
MRVLITGVGGFVGRHLVRHLRELGEDELWGVVRESEPHNGQPVGVNLLVGDLTWRGDVDAAVRGSRPDLVYHLAAQASVAISLDDPAATIWNNVTAQINLLESLAAAGTDPRILVIGSGEEYGLVKPDELPIRETNELRPINPYAVSKAAQGLLGHQYFASHQLKIVRVRAFGQLGPGQSDTFVAPAFARQIAEMEAGRREPVLRVGYLDGERDLTDVRDVVRGYRLALLNGVPGEVYNLGSGQPRAIQSILDTLIACSTVRPRVETDPARLRPIEVPVIYCDPSKLHQATGWAPQIPFEQTVADILEDWRKRVRKDPTP